MHTGYSADAAFPQSVEDKVRACCAAGLEIIGITDHLDFYRTRGPSENRDVEACLRDIRAAKQAFAGELEVLTGIEIDSKKERRLTRVTDVSITTEQKPREGKR